MNRVIEIYDEHKDIGILTRKITQGKEFELVKEFIDYRKNLYKPILENNLAVFIEPKINNSYPDIVFVEYDPNNYVNWNDARNQLVSSDLKILYHIYMSRVINSSDIVSQLGVTWKDTMLSIEKLYDSKLISRKNNGWYIRNKKLLNLKKVEAVEAKLGKLNEVFQQALINKNFASESYILSNSKKHLLMNKMHIFSKFGIGIYYTNNERFYTLNKSSKSKFPVNFNSIYFNEWIGRILNKKGVAIN